MAEVDWAAMLAAGDVAGFNEQRGERARPELFAADLAEKSLVGVDFSNANLEKSDLTAADLTDANLMRANLSGIDGSEMTLVHAVGLRARFKDAWMDKADLTGADFAQATFSDANLEGSRGPHVRFPQAKLKGVNAAGSVWPEADLTESKLHQANLREADLSGADLSGATGAEIDLSGARLVGIQAAEARFPGGRLIGADLSQARLTRANLSGADLTEADLSAADLTQANLSGANLTRAVLRGAVLADANLEGANLEGVDLVGADLSGLEPTELGLAPEVVAELGAYGVSWNEDAPWLFSSASVARQGRKVGVVWTNPDGEEASSARWAVLGGKSVRHGVLPVPADAVLDLQITVEGEDFLVVVLRDRPEGAVVSALPIRDGELLASRSAPLGYEPLVRPVLRQVEGGVHMLGLARQGPTLVVTALTPPPSADPGDPEQLAPRVVQSSKVATARGFLPRQTVLACKGGVVIPIEGNRAGAPRRTPEGFPGRRGLVAQLPDHDDLLAVWVDPRVGNRAGGVRTAAIGKRHAPTAEAVGSLAGVVALDAVAEGDGLRVLWAVAGDDGVGPTQLRSMLLPGGEPADLDGPDDVVDIRMAPGAAALIRMGGELVVIDPSNGKILAEAGG